MLILLSEELNNVFEHLLVVSPPTSDCVTAALDIGANTRQYKFGVDLTIPAYKGGAKGSRLQRSARRNDLNVATKKCNKKISYRSMIFLMWVLIEASVPMPCFSI